jgi:outer membrane receptor protein involved in Fe transport
LGKIFHIRSSSWIDRIGLYALYRGAGDIYWNERNDAREDYYGLIDAKASLHKGAFSMELWIKNLLNTPYHSYYFEAFNNKYVQMGKPQRFGINVACKF